MAGTRTAPTVDGTGFSYKRVSVAVMDWTGEKRSDSYQFDIAATDAQIEAFIAAQQLISNATIYRVEVAEVYSSVADQSNADENVWEEASTNLVIQTKNPTNQSIRTFVPSPINEMFIENTEAIDPTNVDLTAYLVAMAALLPVGYEVVGARFTARRQMNQQIKI